MRCLWSKAQVVKMKAELVILYICANIEYVVVQLIHSINKILKYLYSGIQYVLFFRNVILLKNSSIEKVHNKIDFIRQ